MNTVVLGGTIMLEKLLLRQLLVSSQLQQTCIKQIPVNE
jgi:hypothetical protein